MEDWLSKYQTSFELVIWDDFGRGRLEKRVCYVCSEITLIDALSDWVGAKTLVMVEASREKNGQISQEKPIISVVLPLVSRLLIA